LHPPALSSDDSFVNRLADLCGVASLAERQTGEKNFPRDKKRV